MILYCCCSDLSDLLGPNCAGRRNKLSGVDAELGPQMNRLILEQERMRQRRNDIIVVVGAAADMMIADDLMFADEDMTTGGRSIVERNSIQDDEYEGVALESDDSNGCKLYCHC